MDQLDIAIVIHKVKYFAVRIIYTIILDIAVAQLVFPLINDNAFAKKKES